MPHLGCPHNPVAGYWVDTWLMPLFTMEDIIEEILRMEEMKEEILRTGDKADAERKEEILRRRYPGWSMEEILRMDLEEMKERRRKELIAIMIAGERSPSLSFTSRPFPSLPFLSVVPSPFLSFPPIYQRCPGGFKNISHGNKNRVIQ